MKLKFVLILLWVFTVLQAADTQLSQTKIRDLKNKVVKTQSLYKDGPILINFWSLSCEPCKKEMVYLDKFHQQYAEAGFRIMSINIDSPRSASKVKSYVKSQKYSFPVFLDPRAEFFRKTGGKVMPYVLLVNKNGEIINRHMGFNPGDEKKLEAEIRELLEMKAVRQEGKTLEK